MSRCRDDPNVIEYWQIFVYLQSDVEVPSYEGVPEKRID